jgi:cyclase
MPRTLAGLFVFPLVAMIAAGELLVSPPLLRGAEASAPEAAAPDSARRPHADLGFDVKRVAPGVYAVIRRNPPGFLFDCNSGLVIGRDGVLVIDAQFTTKSANEVIAALKKITKKAVRYVVNTHSHDDHISGNQAYRAAFPGVKFVAHAETARDMTSGYLERRKQLAAAIPQATSAFRAALSTNRGSDGAPLAPDQWVRLENDVALGEQYAAEAPAFRLVTPDVTLTDSLTLSLGDREVIVRFLGRAHSAGDVVLQLRRPDVVFSGDLVVWPVPLAGTTSFPLEYAETLEHLKALPHGILVPGHGPVMTGDAYLDLMIGLMSAIRDQTRAAVARGDSLGALRQGLDLEKYRAAICGDGKVKNQLFQGYVVLPGVQRAFEQASAGTH